MKNGISEQKWISVSLSGGFLAVLCLNLDLEIAIFGQVNPKKTTRMCHENA
jgi:hypothetical protein